MVLRVHDIFSLSCGTVWEKTVSGGWYLWTTDPEPRGVLMLCGWLRERRSLSLMTPIRMMLCGLKIGLIQGEYFKNILHYYFDR